MVNNEPTVDQSDLRIRSSYVLTERYRGLFRTTRRLASLAILFTRAAGIVYVSAMNGLLHRVGLQKWSS